LRQVFGSRPFMFLYSLFFSSNSQRNLPSAPLAYQSLVCLLLSIILPSITSLNSPSPHKTCPIQFFFCCTIVSTNFRLSPMLSSTFSFGVISSQLIFSNLLHSHISSASKRLISCFLKVQISAPYKATLQTIVFIILFLRLLFIFCARSSFLLPNASFAIPILILISLSHRPSAVIILPKYLNLSTCSTLTHSMTIFTIPSPFRATLMTLLFFTFIFMSYLVAVLTNSS